MVNSKLKVLLTRPHENYHNLNYQDLMRVCRVSAPIGLLFLADICKNIENTECMILDPLVNGVFPDVKTLAFPVNDFTWGRHMSEEIHNIPADFIPDVIGISVMFSHLYSSTLESVEILKKKYPHAKILVGGADPTAKFERYLNNSPHIDLIALGEGEKIFKNLLTSIQANQDMTSVPGVAYRSEGKVKRNASEPLILHLDEVRPNYEFIDLKKYFNVNLVNFSPRISYSYPKSNQSINFITSRGCPFKCVFCSIQIHMGSPFRYNSPEYVVREIKYLVDNYDVKHFNFDDDNLTLNLSRFKKICRLIIENKLKITWDTPNGVRGDILDDESLALAIKSGCTYLLFGIESGVQKVIDEIVKKDLNLEESIKNLKRCYKAKLDTGAFFIIGFPGETKQDIRKTINVALTLFWKYKTRPHLNIARPYEGTALYNKAMETQTLKYHNHKISNIPTLVTLEMMIENEEFDLKHLNKEYKRFQSLYILISGINWLLYTLKNPILFTQTMIQHLIQSYKQIPNIKVALTKTYIGVILFPFAIRRKNLY
ncbi:radical SAM protein [Bacteriovorax sp. PP10]|uniref:Radical SAM protein n=1 Tax=Bacteriovorax antarcticus TaxID=3088717 RepID=A0ABU5VUS6_9BACT|nr:radical SAM protein [Bacteriovorax sp. PP10]MEA9356716.1 radical SAM protein [Bacteriovorax sp. PP10]